MKRALDGEGGAEPAFAAVVEDPDERESDRHRLDRRLATEARARAMNGASAPSTWTPTGPRPRSAANSRPRTTTASSRRRPGQANQLDAFHERNYGVFTGYESAVRRRPFLGHRALLRPDGIRIAVETNWVDDLDFDFDAASASTTWMTACSISSTSPTSEIIRSVRVGSAPGRGPARGRIPRRPRRSPTPTTSELDPQVVRRPPARRIPPEARRRGLRPAARLLLPRLRDRRRRA